MDPIVDRRFHYRYNQDAYCRRLETTLAATRRHDGRVWLALEDSCFYPEGGGQPGDRGRLVLEDGAALAVEDTQFANDQLWHLIAADDEARALSLASGSAVTAELDWARRYELMQQHSAEHMISGLVHRRFGWNNVGFNISEEEMTLDFDGPIEAADLVEIEEELQALIYEGRPVEVSYHDAAASDLPAYRAKLEIPGQLRLITVPEVDVCACCGTHVRTSAEIGQILISSAMRYKGGVRLTALAGWRAWRYAHALGQLTRALGQQLSSPAEALPEAVARLEEQRDAAAYARLRLARQMVELQIAGLGSPPPARVLLELPSIEATELAGAVGRLSEAGATLAIAISAQDEGAALVALRVQDGPNSTNY